MANPTRSFPRRPARPAICCTSPIVKSVKSRDFANAGLRNDDGACREIDAGGQRGGCEHGIETTSRISSSTAIFQDGRCPAWCAATPMRWTVGNQCVFADAGILRDHLFQDFGDHGLSSEAAGKGCG